MDILLEKKLKRLEDGIAILEEQLISMKRHYEDLLNNLDEDNFSANYKVQQGNKFSQIEQNSEKVMVTVGTIYDVPEQLFGEKPDSSCDKTKLYSYYTKDKNGEYFPDIGENYKFVCYYRYNSISEKWETVDSQSVVSQFEQTVDGFRLKGAVLIDGNTFINGQFQTADDNGNYAVRIATDNNTAMIQIRNTNDDMPLFYIQRAGLADKEIGDVRVQFLASAGYNAYLDFNGKVNFGNADVYGLYAVFE